MAKVAMAMSTALTFVPRASERSRSFIVAPSFVRTRKIPRSERMSTYNPVYVQASSLIYTDTNNTRVMMKQPVSWLDILESGSSVSWEIWVRRIEVSSEEE